MFISGLIKLFVGIVGSLASLFFLITFIFSRHKKSKLKIAAWTFTSTVGVILLIITVDLFLFPINQKSDHLILSAYREAPLGGIWLALYDDQTWEMGYSSREITSSGNYTIRHDTLTLNAQSGKTILGEISKTSFIINSKNLTEIENSGIRSLEILMNKSEN
ncbi:hypothetical protein [Algoriphagus yeomjeoni]|uniref:Uncharacterized protein n=1 Tax=Algoriphagus yeomjeoni TaxID=291403 RepID=A0A327P0A8_9BACT|nr:hypothetical protein [Algoriphagus yeomjeoni]RAI84847.1 hypothetical protein LV83_03895 [Algoriphagus yeomjeoni]